MRVLVASTNPLRVGTATHPSRGRAAAPLEGELVLPPGPGCTTPGCRCGLDWVGLTSGGRCTTAAVVELELQAEGLVAAFADALANQGLLDAVDLGLDQPPAVILELVDQHLELARAHPVGTLIELASGQPALALSA